MVTSLLDHQPYQICFPAVQASKGVREWEKGLEAIDLERSSKRSGAEHETRESAVQMLGEGFSAGEEVQRMSSDPRQCR